MPIIKVASYNIKYGQGMDGKLDLCKIAEVLANLDADFICLQEVDRYRPRSHFDNQARNLAKMLNMDYEFGAAINYRIGSFGNAILYRYPVLKVINHQLPAVKPERAMLEMHFDVQGNLLRIFNTHMELNRKLRLKQIHNFIVPMIDSNISSAILCGDLNEKPDDPGVKYLLDYLQDSFVVNSGSETATFRADNPLERMDYILLNQYCKAVDYKIIASLASDHLPVFAQIVI